MVFIALFAYLIMGNENNFTKELPVFGVMILAAQKLLPLAQQFYSNITNIRAFKPVLKDILKSLDTSDMTNYPYSDELEYKKSVQIKNVSFRYKDDNPWLFEDVNFSFPKGSCIGLVGESGSGKSAFVDILMGLIEPSKGEVVIDGKKITNSNVTSWWKKISHVPQNVYLLDDTILENIVFGSSIEKSESRAVIAAEKSELGNLLDGFEDGIETKIGERGSLLSGGQQQIIGIARALYREPQMLILDEATSALDTETEEKVIENIFTLNENMTIFMVTHRLSSLSRCDFVIKIEDGKMKTLAKNFDK